MVYPGSKRSAKIHPSPSQKTVAITFAAEDTVLAFVCDGEYIWYHSMLCCFASGSKWWNQFSSAVSIAITKSFLSLEYLRRGYRKRLFCAGLCGLVSTSKEPNEQSFFYSLGFQPSPELCGALLQVFSQYHSHHLISSLLVLFRRGCSWMLVFPSWKFFTIFAQCTHAPISYTRSSLWWISSAGIFLVNKKFDNSTLTKQNIVAPILLSVPEVTWWKLLTSYYSQCSVNRWRHVLNITYSPAPAGLSEKKKSC